MTLKELKDQVSTIITNLRDSGSYLKENDLVDYKMKVNVVAGDPPVETFLIALAKDCISYANGQGGILLIGIKEEADGTIVDTGLPADNIALFNQIDLNNVTQKFKRIIGESYTIDIQPFTVGTRHFVYILIPKSSNANHGLKHVEASFPSFRNATS
jgi:predicted HTH transcriptional regulator